MSSPARWGFCTLRKAVIQTRGASSFMPRWNGSSFIRALNALQARFVVGRRNRPVDRVAVRGGDARQEDLEVQLKPRAQLLGMPVGRWAVVAVVHPQHRDVWLGLHAQVQNHGLVRAEVSGDDRAPARVRNRPASDLSVPT